MEDDANPKEVIIQEVCRVHGFDPGALELLLVGPEGFLLVLPDEASAIRIYNEGRPLITESFRLLFRRWTRFAAFSRAALLHLVDIDICGIPPHACNLATA
ncbi:hypothetical protein E2562_003167 [Oryza meyeriana var. granulata]|uniref:DUF4283 domain-containing protein n=1 Tax=Oryza meyeriana var. granulata TaxID=110450 RepID=A0A6G1EUR0_9ORYZ|nr:hypothetical protein E2562_003167 [Oryza meyeriana var. granulata]